VAILNYENKVFGDGKNAIAYKDNINKQFCNNPESVTLDKNRKRIEHT